MPIAGPSGTSTPRDAGESSDKAPAVKVSPKCGFRGDSWEDFEFTDITAPARSMFKDAGSSSPSCVRKYLP